jgi:hypothetical protein
MRYGIQNVEESGRANFGRRVEVLGKRVHGALVDLEEKAVFAAEVLKD